MGLQAVVTSELAEALRDGVACTRSLISNVVVWEEVMETDQTAPLSVAIVSPELSKSW